jgi:hypothetical protein
MTHFVSLEGYSECFLTGLLITEHIPEITLPNKKARSTGLSVTYLCLFRSSTSASFGWNPTT